MNINRSGYYKWKKRKNKCNRYEQDRNLLTELLKEGHKRHSTYGYHNLAALIREETGWVFSDNLAHKCCKMAGIKSTANGWIKEELYNDFGLYYSKDVPKLIQEYIHYFNNQRFSVKCGRKSPVRFRTEQGFL